MDIELVCALKTMKPFVLRFCLKVVFFFLTQRQFSQFKAKKRTLSETPYLIKKKKEKKRNPTHTENSCTKISLQVPTRFPWFVVFAHFLIGLSRELSKELCSAASSVTKSETGSCLSALLTNLKSGCRADCVESSNRGVPLNQSGSNLPPITGGEIKSCFFLSFFLIELNQINVAQTNKHASRQLTSKVLLVAPTPATAVQPSEAQCETGDLISFLFSSFKKKREGKRPTSCRNKKANTTGELNTNEQLRSGCAHFCRLVDLIFRFSSHASVCSTGGGRILSVCYNRLLLDCWDYFSGGRVKIYKISFSFSETSFFPPSSVNGFTFQLKV